MYTLHVLCVCSVFLALIVAQDNAMEIECGRETYGSPLIRDCQILLESFANHRDSSLRVFDEEQLRVQKDGSWPGVGGIVDVSRLDGMVQIPRYFTLSQYVPSRPFPLRPVPQVSMALMTKFRFVQFCTHELFR